ncbi:MAG: hypothetical protein WD380_04865 [Gaiellaceae bacterium]
MGDEPADEEGQRGGDVVGERGAGLPAAVDEDAEIAKLLRNLMGRDDEPGDDPEAKVENEGGADGEPAQEVVQAIGDQNQYPSGACSLTGR